MCEPHNFIKHSFWWCGYQNRIYRKYEVKQDTQLTAVFSDKTCLIF